MPGGSGFVSASADKTLKMWAWGKVANGEECVPRLTITADKSVSTGQDVLAVRVSPDGHLIAASLISNVIKVQYSLRGARPSSGTSNCACLVLSVRSAMCVGVCM